MKYEIRKIVIYAFAGSDITDIADEAIILAHKENCEVHFSFNGTKLLVNTRSTKKEILDSYYMQIHCIA